MNRLSFAIAVAWWNPTQRQDFLRAWGLDENSPLPPWLVMEQDVNKDGGAKTKNRAMRRAIDTGASVVVCLDDDCFPTAEAMTLEQLAEGHINALAPQPVPRYAIVTDPPSRGTPFMTRDLMMPVAASMGFWTEIGDYCGPRQLVYGALHPMTFDRRAIFGQYFPLCGMNYAFRPSEWEPFNFLVEGVGRFDDIWMGYLWQKAAYDRGCCFNLNGPLVRHSRQSDVWANLRDEAQRLEANETAWQRIANCHETTYTGLRAYLPMNTP